MLQCNPHWQGADWPGRIAAESAWSPGRACVPAMLWLDADVPFTHASWRGRMRACRGVGATLAPAEVEAFDRALAASLDANVAPAFTVRHRIDAHLFDPWPDAEASMGSAPS